MKWKISELKELEDKIWRCTACGTCKVAYDYGPPPTFGEICPAGTEFGFEGMTASKGKIAFARGILSGELALGRRIIGSDLQMYNLCRLSKPMPA